MIVTGFTAIAHTHKLGLTPGQKTTPRPSDGGAGGGGPYGGYLHFSSILYWSARG